MGDTDAEIDVEGDALALTELLTLNERSEERDCSGDADKTTVGLGAPVSEGVVETDTVVEGQDDTDADAHAVSEADTVVEGDAVIRIELEGDSDEANE